MIHDGPFKSAVEASRDKIIKQELITYRIVNDTIVKEVVDRRFLKSGDYIDSTSQEPLTRKTYAT